MDMIGHNGGPTMQPGAAWRTHCWRAARAALLPTLPLEVLRLRVKRAKALGLEYKTYASVRAASGHDVVAFLFSSNALRVRALAPAMDAAHTARLLAAQDCALIGLAVAPLNASLLATANPQTLHATHPAPYALSKFRDQAQHIRTAIANLPRAGVVLVGDHGLEHDWMVAGRLAAYIPAERFFGT
jgi:hypothetical protein